MPVTRDPNAVGLVAKSSVELGDVTAHLDDKIDKGMDRRGTAAPVDDVVDESAPAVVKSAGRAKRRGELAKVTGIRHWSTPTYTRVAIDLGDDVTYEAARVPNPDRIYFDLHGTQLARELVGKSFAVTDDGFLKKIRAAQFSNDMTRVVLDVNDVTEYSAFLLPNPYRLIIDIHGGKPVAAATETAALPDAPSSSKGPASDVPAPRAAANVKSTPGRPVPNTVATKSSNSVEVASLSAQPGRVEATDMPTSQPISAVVKAPSGAAVPGGDAAADSAAAGSVAGSTKKSRRGTKSLDPAVPARAAVPTADGETSLVRALGLKIGRIVIDAGHGGHDSGTLGAEGIQEKDVVLDVALRLGKLLHERLGDEIIYTRSDDTFIPLETRTAIANKAQADLFLSIHANSSSDATARGVETYYLNFTSDPTALNVAARENAVSGQSIHQLSDLVKKITLKDKIAESREFAGDVEQGLYGGLQHGNAGLKDRGVKKAPFVVLIGANMPSILAEISFVTNPRDANQLEQPEYRQRVAESLYRGVAKYAAGLSGTKALPTERARGN
jgi:N-acetylmuramoyl-L-alanine amidase